METAIFVVRILLSLLLYAFLATLFMFLWRDIRSTSHQPATLAAREKPGRLRIMRGSDGLQEGSILVLTPFTTLGRSDANTIKLNDTYASAEHALIAWRSGQWWLEDRGSRNGTLLNEVRVEEPLIVSNGDVIGIGQLRLKFEYATED
jgi:pSer/pThr/pTyr-binding forkhead associated (FHA) protein